MTYTVGYTKDGTPLGSQPGFIGNDPVSEKNFTVRDLNSSDRGAYAVTITAEIPILNPSTGLNWQTSSQFTLTIYDECETSTISIGSSIMPTTNVNYVIGSGPLNTQFDASAVTVSPPTTTCTLEFDINIMTFSNLWNHGSFDPSTLVLTYDRSSMPPNDKTIALVAKFAGYSTKDEHQFKIEHSTDPCLTLVLSIDPAFVLAISYNIGSGQ